MIKKFAYYWTKFNTLEKIWNKIQIFSNQWSIPLMSNLYYTTLDITKKSKSLDRKAEWIILNNWAV